MSKIIIPCICFLLRKLCNKHLIANNCYRLTKKVGPDKLVNSTSFCRLQSDSCQLCQSGNAPVKQNLNTAIIFHKIPQGVKKPYKQLPLIGTEKIVFFFYLEYFTL